MKATILRLLAVMLVAGTAYAQDQLAGWRMQNAAKVEASAAAVSAKSFKVDGWYKATVPGTVLTTLVDNHVYPEPLYGENMRSIPEDLNRKTWWYRTTVKIPLSHKGRHTWLHFEGINYSAEIWVNGSEVGTIRGAFLRGDFDISTKVRPGQEAVVAVKVSPQPHPGTPHEHVASTGVGKNGGETAIDGPTFLSTIGWDWLPAIRDRDTGLWLPVSLYATGEVEVKNTVVRSLLSASNDSADLSVDTSLKNLSSKPVSGMLTGVIEGFGTDTRFSRAVTLPANDVQTLSLTSASIPELHVVQPKLWWPNGYGKQNLYTLTLKFESGKAVSQSVQTSFGIRRIEYQVSDSENLTLSVNGVRIMARGGNWGLDEGMKRIPRERLDAQFHMHALAHMNIIRNWVGQSTSPDFYDLADRYGILLWDEFFQPNPGDGPNPTDIPTYMANVTDKVLRYRNHPSIAVWCARNEGYPPKDLDDTLKALMAQLDPTRLYQSNSADGRGVSSHGPYFWRAPRYFYAFNESFKTEVGSISVPTIESIQGMMPRKDWETINDDWAQHDMAKGAQRGDEYPQQLARRFGRIRNLADFVRKGQLANYEAFRAMYEGRNAQMFQTTTGVITWMSHPAQPSFVWQLYHYDLEPNAALYAVKNAAESIHVQLNEANGAIQIVNNRPEPLARLTVTVKLYSQDSALATTKTYTVSQVPASSTAKAAQIEVPARISALYFVALDLKDSGGTTLSKNFYWQNVAQDDFTALEHLPTATLTLSATQHVEGEKTILQVEIANDAQHIALTTHLQLHRGTTGDRVLPVFYSDNYISLVPGEIRTVFIEAATKDLHGEIPFLAVDGYNVTLKPVASPVAIQANFNADPMHWPATNLVP